MKNVILGLCLVGFTGCGYTRVEPGHVGVKVNLYGNKRGG